MVCSSGLDLVLDNNGAARSVINIVDIALFDVDGKIFARVVCGI